MRSEIIAECIRLDKAIGKIIGINFPEIPEDKLPVATEWLKADVIAVLCQAEDYSDALDAVNRLLKTSCHSSALFKILNLNKICKEVEIRRDFDAALKSVERGSELSATLGWSFYPEDVSKLARIYEQGRHQEKIVELLTDCNFHYESHQFLCGKASEYIKEETA